MPQFSICFTSPSSAFKVSELEGLLLPPVSQISKLHTLLSHGPAWANPPGNAGQSGLGGIRARLLPITAMPT